MKRREFLGVLSGAAAAWPDMGHAQQTKALVAVLSPIGAVARNLEALRQGLHDLGYDEGRNFDFALRHLDGDMTKAAAAAEELLKLKPDVIVAGGSTAVELHKATRTTPIVMTGLGGDPVKLGLAGSLSRPGGNVTGLLFNALTASGTLGFVGKRLALLRELLPALATVGAVLNPKDDNDKPSIDALSEAARDLHLDYRLREASSLDDLERAFAALTRDGVEALYVSGSPLFNRYRVEIAKMVAQTKRPSIGTLREQAVEGFLMSYGTSLPDTYRRAAGYVAKILQGTKAADLPIEQPTKFDLIVNMKAAKALGLTVPDKLIALADEVIE